MTLRRRTQSRLCVPTRLNPRKQSITSAGPSTALAGSNKLIESLIYGPKNPSAARSRLRPDARCRCVGACPHAERLARKRGRHGDPPPRPCEQRAHSLFPAGLQSGRRIVRLGLAHQLHVRLRAQRLPRRRRLAPRTHLPVPLHLYGGSTYSKLFGNQDCSAPDFGWMQGYDKWYAAMFNRISHNSFSPYGVDTEEGRELVKNWLWNHQGDGNFFAGGICGIGVASACKQGSIGDDPEGRNARAGVVGMKYVRGLRVGHR